MKKAIPLTVSHWNNREFCCRFYDYEKIDLLFELVASTPVAKLWNSTARVAFGNDLSWVWPCLKKQSVLRNCMIFILHLNEVVFPILPKTADKMLALDVSEQTFSVVNINKACLISKLNDQHLRYTLRTATTKLALDVDAPAEKVSNTGPTEIETNFLCWVVK